MGCGEGVWVSWKCTLGSVLGKARKTMGGGGMRKGGKWEGYSYGCTVVAPVTVVSTGSPSSTTVEQDAPSPSNSQTTPETQPPVIPNDVEEDNHDIEVAIWLMIRTLVSQFQKSLLINLMSDSIHTIVHLDHQISKHNSKWTKDHPLENIIGELARPVSIRLQLHEQALFCYYDAFLMAVEPKTYKDALIIPAGSLMKLGGILKNKARLVAHGYRQEGEELIEREVYVDQISQSRVLSLKKALFGFKLLPACGMTVVFVFDILMTSLKAQWILLLFLCRKARFFQNPVGIFINLSKYVLESLKKYGFDSCDPVDTPMVEKSKLDDDKKGSR
ncbi:hypothetical protein Tco_0374363 [Tanacetum coccineum]